MRLSVRNAWLLKTNRGFSFPLPSERLDQINRLIADEHWENRQEQKPFHVECEVHNGQYVK